MKAPPVFTPATSNFFTLRRHSGPVAGTFGNVARGAFIGPGSNDFDTALSKNFTFTEEYRLQFRVEAFNVLNHTNFASPNPVTFSGNNYSPSAGVITQTANSSRQIQLALKLMF